MPQKKRGHGWTKIKSKRKCKCKRRPKPEYQHPLSVRYWKSICYKSLRLVKQCYLNHGRIWQKYDRFIKNHLRDLSTLDPDSIPSYDLFLDLTKTFVSVLNRLRDFSTMDTDYIPSFNLFLDLTKTIVFVLCKNNIPDLNFTLFLHQEYPSHFI